MVSLRDFGFHSRLWRGSWSSRHRLFYPVSSNLFLPNPWALVPVLFSSPKQSQSPPLRLLIPVHLLVQPVPVSILAPQLHARWLPTPSSSPLSPAARLITLVSLSLQSYTLILVSHSRLFVPVYSPNSLRYSSYPICIWEGSFLLQTAWAPGERSVRAQEIRSLLSVSVPSPIIEQLGTVIKWKVQLHPCRIGLQIACSVAQWRWHIQSLVNTKSYERLEHAKGAESLWRF